MRPDYKEIESNFLSINSILKEIASNLEIHLNEIFEDIEHLDRVTSRVKAKESFLSKTLKKNQDGSLKYKTPIKEIQDFIGARIIVYYKTDVEKVVEIIKKYFSFVEKTNVIPEDVSKFGYEGLHFICFIPNTMYSNHKANLLMPDFFELQIKTLYQHAWSQAGHGIGYKPETPLNYEEERKLAFMAAQSWGADTILADLINNKNKQEKLYETN